MAFTSDTFTGTNGTALTSHTGEAGATWTKYSGVVNDTIEGNRLQHGSSGYSEQWTYASGTPATAEYDVEYVFRYTGSLPADAYNGVMARFNTSNGDHYRVVYESFSGFLRWKLEKVVSSSATSLGTYSQTPSADTDYAIKLEIRDATKKVYIDGVERISSADNAITAAGKVGIRTYGNQGTSWIDSLVASDVGGGGGNRRRAIILGAAA